LLANFWETIKGVVIARLRLFDNGAAATAFVCEAKFLPQKQNKENVGEGEGGKRIKTRRDQHAPLDRG